MFNILICDDDKHFCGEMESNIINWAAKNRCPVNVDQCYSGKSFRQYVGQEERPDLVFLDIELGDETGVRIGKYIREFLKDENLQIVYISSHTRYAMELFKIRPFDFLIKPVSAAELEYVLSKYCEIMLCGKKNYFIYQQKKYSHRIDMENIIYFQSDRKKIRIYTNDFNCGRQEVTGENAQGDFIEYYGNLVEAMRQLDREQFWYIHKSYVVNVKYVNTYGRSHFMLQNGTVIPVSRSRWKEVQKWILQRRDT